MKQIIDGLKYDSAIESRRAFQREHQRCLKITTNLIESVTFIPFDVAM